MFLESAMYRHVGCTHWPMAIATINQGIDHSFFIHDHNFESNRNGQERNIDKATHF